MEPEIPATASTYDVRVKDQTCPALPRLPCRACPARGAFRGHVEKTKRINELLEPEILFGKLKLK
jgi:hypothetical protein